MKIGIAGAGGIGSNVAAYLVRGGVRWLKIVDFDRVERGNLNRQFYFHDQIGRSKVDALAENLTRIAPDVQIQAVAMKLEVATMTEIFCDCDVVVEGLDNQMEKKLLLETLSPTGRWIVSASGVAGHCMDAIQVRRMGGGHIVGDFHTDVSQAKCHAPKVAAVAAIMANLILIKGGYHE